MIARATRLAGLALLASATVAVVGCAGIQTIPVDPALWSHKETRIGVAIVVSPPARAYRAGPQGLLDVAINSSMASDLEKHLGALKPSTFEAVADQFERRLTQAGFATKRIGDVDLTTLRSLPKAADGYFERDVSALAARHGVDAVLLVSAERWGTVRPYYGFIPLGAPKALFQITGRLIDRDGRLRWQIATNEAEASVPVSGDWDQPPGFPNLTAALEIAQRAAAAALERSFFGPMQAAPARAAPAVGAPP